MIVLADNQIGVRVLREEAEAMMRLADNLGEAFAEATDSRAVIRLEAGR